MGDFEKPKGRGFLKHCCVPEAQGSGKIQLISNH